MNKSLDYGVVICLPIYAPPPDLLKAQLLSIMSQSHTNWKCLIIIDGDLESRPIVEQVIGSDVRFEIRISEENKGLWKTIEDLLVWALVGECDYIALADQDDLWHSDKIESQIASIVQSGKSMTSCDAYLCTPDQNLVSNGLRSRKREVTFTTLKLANEVSGAGILMTRDFVNYSIPFPEIMGRKHHDHYLALLAMRLQELHVSEQKHYIWIQHGQNFSGDRRIHGKDKLMRNITRLKLRNAIVCMFEVNEYEKAISSKLTQKLFKNKTVTEIKSAGEILFIVRKRYLHIDLIVGFLQHIQFLIFLKCLSLFRVRNTRKGRPNRSLISEE
jgi:glycosyltransferase involved in cell wall biosynthesis